MTATRVESATPITDYLWSIGFTIKAKVDRLDLEIPDGQGGTLKTNFEITAYPERGEARRLFSRKGPAKAKVKSNLPFEQFAYEQEHRITTLKDLYTESAAVVLFEMLKEQAPTISEPA